MSNGSTDQPSDSGLLPLPSALSRRDLFFRIAVALVLILSLVLAWWSTTQVLAPRLQESRRLISTVTGLQTETDQLERKFSAAEIQQITNKFSQIPSQLFGNPAALEEWLNILREQALPLGLDLQAEVGKPLTQTAGGRKFTVIPATLSVDAQPGAGNAIASPCQRILRLTQYLAQQEKRTDLVELTVLSSSTNSISRAILVLNCWAGEEAVP
jgi:hypothetical protein